MFNFPTIKSMTILNLNCLFRCVPSYYLNWTFYFCNIHAHFNVGIYIYSIKYRQYCHKYISEFSDSIPITYQHFFPTAYVVIITECQLSMNMHFGCTNVSLCALTCAPPCNGGHLKWLWFYQDVNLHKGDVWGICGR